VGLGQLSYFEKALGKGVICCESPTSAWVGKGSLASKFVGRKSWLLYPGRSRPLCPGKLFCTFKTENTMLKPIGREVFVPLRSSLDREFH
jgi:hypothetical protein